MPFPSCKKKEIICIFFTFAVLAFFYVFRCTESSLCFDEGIEYWVSKSISGPSYGFVSNRANMYERICATIQPPLYNFLIFLWLKICDTEFWFKFFSSVCFFSGCIGFYLTCREFANKKASCAFTLIFGLCRTFINYAHEAAEYACLFCFVCWIVLYFVKCLKTYTWKNIILYFTFAILSIYSQYGACFVILGTGIILFARAFRCQSEEKTTDNLIRFFISFVISVLFFIIPLFALFIKRQLLYYIGSNNHQLTLESKNILLDWVIGFYKANAFFFGEGTTIFCCLILSCLLTYSIITIQKRILSTVFTSIVISSLIAWTVYWLAVRFNIYKIYYSSGFGNRWGMAFCSLFGILFSYTLIEFYKVLLKTKARDYLVLIHISLFVIFGAISFKNSVNCHNVKTFAREAYTHLESYKKKEQLVLVEEWYQPAFAFYMTHGKIVFSEKDVVYLKSHAKNESKEKLLEEYKSILQEKEIDSFWYFCGKEPTNQDFMFQAFSELGYSTSDEIKFGKNDLGDPTLILFVKQ